MSGFDKREKKWKDKLCPILSNEEKDKVYAEIMANCMRVGDCLLYCGNLDANGYGIKKIGGKTRTVSRFVLAYVTRESIDLPPHIAACHDTRVCVYRHCCDPKHLYWGSHAENAKTREADERFMRDLKNERVMPVMSYIHSRKLPKRKM